MSTFSDQIARVVANLTAEERTSIEEALRLAYRVGRQDGAADLTPRRATTGPVAFCSDRDAARAILAGEYTDQDVLGVDSSTIATTWAPPEATALVDEGDASPSDM